MPTRRFEAVMRRQGGSVILDLVGEIDAAAETGLEAAYTAAEQDKSSAIILNFRDVDYMNSTGIALIVSLLGRSRKAHRPLFAFGLSEHYTEIFNITRLSDFIGIYSDEASAVAGSSING